MWRPVSHKQLCVKCSIKCVNNIIGLLFQRVSRRLRGFKENWNAPHWRIFPASCVSQYSTLLISCSTLIRIKAPLLPQISGRINRLCFSLYATHRTLQGKRSFAFTPQIFLCAQPPEGSSAEPPLPISACGVVASGEHVVSKSLGLCSIRQMEHHHHHRQPQMSPFDKTSSQILSDQPFFSPLKPGLPEFCGLLKSTAVRNEDLIQHHYNISIHAERCGFTDDKRRQNQERV